MINRFSWHYRLVEKLLICIKWYFEKQNYYFTTRIIYKSEKEKQDKTEQSYQLKYWKTKEGKEELAKSQKKIDKFLKKYENNISNHSV